MDTRLIKNMFCLGNVRVGIVLCVCMVNHPLWSAGLVTFDANAFKNLSKEDMLVALLSGLRDHDGAVSNAELTIQESEDNRNRDKHFGSSQKLILYTMGNKYRVDGETKTQLVAGGQYQASGTVVWDGQHTTSMSSTVGNPGATGSIYDGQPAPLSSELLVYVNKYTDQLGTHRNQLSNISLADWLDLLIHDRPVHWDMQLVEEGAEKYISVKIIDVAQQQFEFQIDPSRQFIVHRYTFSARGVGAQMIKVLDRRTQESRIVNGVWVPWHITEEDNNRAQTLSATVDIRVMECQLRNVSDADFSVKFKAGTRVLDDTKHESYTVQQDGSHKSERLLNPKTGKITGGQPSTTPATQPLGKD